MDFRTLCTNVNINSAGPSDLQRFSWRYASVIVIAAVAVYWNSFGGPFVFDDLSSIPENPTIRRLWPLSEVLSPPSGTTVEGRPLVNLTLAINYALGGTNVFGYHAVNLAIHILTALTLFGVIRRTLNNGPETTQFSIKIALASTLIWLVHPLQTESVTYIIQRAESLMALFYLLTIYCVIRAPPVSRDAERSAEAAPQSAPLRVAANRWYVLAIVVCACGMATKEVMVTAPLVVLLYDRAFLAGSFREAWRCRRGLYLGLAGTWLILAWLVIGAGGRSGSAGFGAGMSPLDYALTQFGAIVRYLQLSFWPQPLVFDYGTALATTPGEIVPPALIVVALVSASLFAWRRSPPVGFLMIVFFLILAPSSSIVPVATETAAEHRVYLPLASISILVVIATRRVVTKLTLPASVPQLALFVVVFALSTTTFQRNRDYATAFSLWSDTVRKRPDNPRAHLNLGVAMLDAKLFADALREFTTAIELKSDYSDAWNNRGHAHRLQQNYEHALHDFDRAIELNPKYAIAFYNRGGTFAEMQESERAIADFERAIELNPTFVAAITDRGVMHSQLKQFGRADEDFSKAIELQPDYAAAWYNRALSRVASGQYDRARDDLRRFEELGGVPDPALVRLLNTTSN